MAASVFSRRCKSDMINFLGDSHFQTYVNDDVENLFDCISHFLYFVHLLVTHTTRKSMLNSVHKIVHGV